MELTSALEIRVKNWFDAIQANEYTKYYSFADDFKNYPLLACESSDQQNYVELSEGTTTLTGYNIVFAIADKVSKNNIPAKLITNLSGVNNDLVFTAVALGDAGNSLGIQYLEGEAFGVTEDRGEFFVSFIAGSTTAKDVMDYFNTNLSDTFTVTIAPENNGAGLIASMPESMSLTGGISNGEIFTKDKLQKKWEDIFEARSSGIKGVILAKEYTRTVRESDNIMHLYAAIRITK